ncbi:hypothetical protein Cch01nite_22780 [Cellulomonas chitinilytica]|uniref:DUF2599 domain-containing protein n=1 Tax=Cellulomonas chitinilytica TaxID=398759 RepID=A0A919P5V4_9CELL|nr:DUF2599 domain-containing protein [Cellulomonas chitinilytica]GIG21554.1 hypothetical protein Cch01nite_22780 [Cellulomonas chitinilytica]
MARPSLRARGWLVVPASVLLVTVLTACSRSAPDTVPTSPGPPSTTSTPTPSTPDDSAPAVRRDGVPVTSGAVTLAVRPTPPGTVTPAPQDDGSVRATFPVPPQDTTVALVAAPEGAVWDVLADGTAVVRDAAGTLLAGVTPTGGRLERADDEVVRLVTPAPGATGVELWVATVAVKGADWGEREGGRSLAVTPSAWARAGGLAAETALREQLVAAEPEAGTATMQAQLGCHELGAPDKETWNLEPWRPDVGPLDMLGARCNP